MTSVDPSRGNIPDVPSLREQPLEPATEARLRDALRADDRRVIVFDDDPTGTQTVSEVNIVLDGSNEELSAFFESSARALYVLTNSRALPRDAAVRHLETLIGRVERAAGLRRWAPVLRGDSTLRGHVFAEINALGGDRGDVALFVPALPEAGRITKRGRHYMAIGGRYRNVADTEYSRDPDFGYRSRDLIAWVTEVGQGWTARSITRDQVRRKGPAAIAEALTDAPPRTVVIPDAESREDVAQAVLGLLLAEHHGRPVVARGAPTFAALRSGLRARKIETVPTPIAARVLIVCGSHTSATNDQLAVLEQAGIPPLILEASDGSGVIDRAIAHLDGHGVAVIATPRDPIGGSAFATGTELMRSLVAAARQLAPMVDGLIAKGGITSAEVARGVGAHVARVEGQLLPGVALWALQMGPSTLPYAVVPGNVGAPDTLLTLLAAFGHRPFS